jgi:hypothetical protein
MRGVSVVVPSDPGTPRVELHLAERRGEIHVAVRTPDPQVRQVLRSELPVLVERLEQSGYRAEVFSPAAERSAAATHTAESYVTRAEAAADAGGRDPMSWGFDDGRRRRDPEAQQQPAPRPKSNSRSFFHDFLR